MNNSDILIRAIKEYQKLGITEQINYDKFYLYSLITHSTAIEGSTVTEVENQLLFDRDISAKGKSISEQMMNIDLKNAYERSMQLAKDHKEYSPDMLKQLAAIVMKNTGSTYNTPLGSFNSAKGELRLVNVTAGVGGNSYMNYQKVPQKLEEFCKLINERRKNIISSDDIYQKYILSFDAHYILVSIHPWVDGNGRMSRLVTNHLQFEAGLIPSKVRKENKAEYIESLIESRNKNSIEPFRNFMMNEHISNLNNEIENFKKSNDYDPMSSFL